MKTIYKVTLDFDDAVTSETHHLKSEKHLLQYLSILIEEGVFQDAAKVEISSVDVYEADEIEY